jgi:uncharacterized repeat protein (TIGR01451 family)
MMLGLMLAAMRATADDAVQVETTLAAELLETRQLDSGQQTSRFVPAGTVAQGQVVYYTVRVRNPAPVAAKGIVVVQAIPENTVYVPASAAGPNTAISFSTDGGGSFATSKLPKQTDSGGTRAAMAEDYTHIRWELRYDLAPGATALLRFRAIFR